MRKDRIEEYVRDINILQTELEEIAEYDHIKILFNLQKQLVFIGQVAGDMAELYKRIYADRHRVYWNAYQEAKGNKKMAAEMAVIDLRQEEAEAYGSMKRWNNAFESTREHINVLKYKIKITIEDGSSKIMQ